MKYCYILAFIISIKWKFLGLKSSKGDFYKPPVHLSICISPFPFFLNASSPKTELRCSSPGVQTIRPIVTGPVS